MTKFYKATDSTGFAHTRSTVNRAYSNAIVATGKKYSSWAGRPDLARKEAAKWQGPVEVLDAVEITDSEYRAILKANKEGVS